jgi:YidC/Oxa1 family membrane protein insertase
MNLKKPLKNLLKNLLVLPILLFSSTALANVKPQWISNADLDGDQHPEVIFTGNLYDLAFNERGEMVSWYVKPVVGSSTINTQVNPPDISQLQTQMANSLFSGQKGLVVGDLGNTDPVSNVKTPQITVVGDVNKPDKLLAQFEYQQGAVTVQKKIEIDPSRFTLAVQVNVIGIGKYSLEFAGVNGSDVATMQAQIKNSPTIINAGPVSNINYVAIQKDPPFWNPNDSGSLIVQPVDKPGGNTSVNTSVNATLVPGIPAQSAGQISIPHKFKLELSGPADLKIYGGRKELVRLQLEGWIDLPGIFEPNIWGRVSQGLMWLMTAIHGVIGSWFFTIALITVLIRLILWPLMHRQYLSTAEMQAIQPEVKEIQAKFKENPERLQQETMRLYKDHSVNPAAGCLPALVQMPIWFVMWRVPYYYEFREGFAWLPDLSLPDTLYILPVLYVGVNILNLWITTRKTPDMFRQQVFIYPIFAFIALQFPAGATIYFVISTLIGVIQYLVINRWVAQHMEKRNVTKVVTSKIVK